jgi:ACS family tartrate transporter-like MFS transporter
VRTGEDPREERVVGQVIGRLVPFIFLCYVVAYLDRVNIGFAAADMQRDLDMGDAVYGLGAGLFFLGYFLFEIPSNLILERVGARRWMARIMIVWGIVSMAMALVEGPASFYALRFLLGLAEAGFFPGMVLYLSYWIPERQRARAGALFMMAAPVSMVLGSPVSEALLKLDGGLGLHGWQWLFVVEGVPAVILGVVALRYLTDRPEVAEWLAPGDRAWLAERMAGEERGIHQHASALRNLLTPRIGLLCSIYFLNTVATYGLFLFLPKILAEASAFRGFALSAITSIPFVFALAGMVLIGRHSDRTGERKWHVATCGATAATGLVLAAVFQASVPLLVVSFTLSQVGQRSFQGVFWAIPRLFLGGASAAAGIALINAVGNLGGFVGPSLVGFLRRGSADYGSGLLALAGGLFLQAVLVSTLRLPARGAELAAEPPVGRVGGKVASAGP